MTTVLLSASQYLKDNRILPAGFDKATAHGDIAVRGARGRRRGFQRRRRPGPLRRSARRGRRLRSPSGPSSGTSPSASAGPATSTTGPQRKPGGSPATGRKPAEAPGSSWPRPRRRSGRSEVPVKFRPSGDIPDK
ncbi:MAG: hypothetical protein M0C28_26330 [Candidatus Moduliflexus flocculans]|nr:hypothetical protein [Candidatus Moduliflexus flocculans]